MPKSQKAKQGEGAEGTPEEFPQELFVAFDGRGDDRYITSSYKEVDHLCESPSLVAKYRLVKTRKVRLVKSVKVVAVK